MSTIKVGQKAPAFAGKIQSGKEVSLSNYSGRKLILYFYPKDLTPGCTAQSCSLGENFGTLRGKGFEVLGVSADNAKKHVQFIEKYSLPFDLLADVDRQTIMAYGVWGKKKFMGREYEGILRTTFIISENGTIEHILDKPDTKNHADEILSLYP